MSKDHRPKVLGIAASLRNARWGIGNEKLVESLYGIDSVETLNRFLKAESEMHLANFIESGREQGLDFTEIYKNLKKNRGDSGLSNSEVALAAALWEVRNMGCEFDHLSLSEYFLANGNTKNLDELKEKLLEADGLLISGPVYFGDRGSLAQSLIRLMRSDSELCKAMAKKFYAGIAVGAKRNGGQETTLIYQMLDMSNLGCLTLGNDSDTTAQYGGTGHAGDVGTMHKDSYGLDTAMGTGRRIGRLVYQQHGRELVPLKDKLKINFVILQDKAGQARKRVEELVAANSDTIRANILDVTDKTILRCLACDICPTSVDIDEKYRCIITSSKDSMSDLHQYFIGADGIVPVIYSSPDYTDVESNYQTFVERTRYLRRGDYVMSDNVAAPLIFEEIGARENYHIRALTSMIRHHTVMTRPILAQIHEGKTLNQKQVDREWSEFLDAAECIACARLAGANDWSNPKYNPVGYVLSADKDAEDERLQKRSDMMEARHARVSLEGLERLASEADEKQNS